jgi:MFS transporter, NHS family, xanthosine permease
MNFLQFFVWGSWLISLGGYMIVDLKFSGWQVGNIYATMGIASLFMPTLMGIIADRKLNAELVYGICHLVASTCLFFAANVTDYPTMYVLMLVNVMFYMPTLALNNSVSYTLLQKENIDVEKVFPSIRVWGSVGFVCAMWVIDLGQWSISPIQLYVSSVAGILLGMYAFTLPACKPAKKTNKGSWVSVLGLDAFALLKRKRVLVFLIFSMFLGAALQITNTFGEAFLHSFSKTHPDSFALKHPSILMSVSQISETLFILTIPFFLKRFGIKGIMILCIFSWVMRFALFGIGNPGEGFTFLFLSMIFYGMAFDFFNIAGSLFIRSEADSTIVSSAQGLFMLMTNGVGAYIGGTLSGWVVDYFTIDGTRDWQSIWFTFAGYAFLLGIVFPLVFKSRASRVTELSHAK